MKFFRDLTLAGRAVIVILAGLVLGGAIYWVGLPSKKHFKAQLPGHIALRNDDPIDMHTAVDIKTVALPSARVVARNANREIREQNMTWISQSGLYIANGGPRTTKGSPMERHGVYTVIEVQDDMSKQFDQLLAFTKAWVKDGGNPTEGFHFIVPMGGSYAQFADSWNELLRPICKAAKKEPALCEVRGIGAHGLSYGEDFHGTSPEVADNPKLALGRNTYKNGRGGAFAAVFRDDDQNIGIYWARANGLKVNPDDKTFDLNSVNFINAATFVDAGEKYINNYCEQRDVVEDGKPSKIDGQSSIQVCAIGADSWMPVDLTMFKRRGGFVKAYSTRENKWQMASLIVGVNGWLQENEDLVAHYLAAASEGGDMMKGYRERPDILRRAAEIAVKIYNDPKGMTVDEWVEYFPGKTVVDKRTGREVLLGGSRTINLGDQLDYFGVGPDVSFRYRDTYEQFGNQVAKLWPTILKRVPPIQGVLDTRYLEKAATLTKVTKPDAPVYKSNEVAGAQVSEKPWFINFDTNQDTPTADSLAQIEEMRQMLSQHELLLELGGHTDNVGDKTHNQDLSRRRALAVKRLLQQSKNGTREFPNNRFIKVEGYGDAEPFDKSLDQNSKESRRLNRRVVVTVSRRG